MVHTAMNPDTSGRTPQWLIEGVALYVSGEDLSAYAPAVEAAGERPSLVALSRRDALGKLDADAQSAAYVVASTSGIHMVVVRQSSGQ